MARIAGVDIPANSWLLYGNGPAGHDADEFADPESFRMDRKTNRHLAFGLGIHYCLGAPLARLEGQIAINTLLRRLPDLRLAVPDDALRRRPGLVLHGLRELPVTFASHRAVRVCLPDFPDDGPRTTE